MITLSTSWGKQRVRNIFTCLWSKYLIHTTTSSSHFDLFHSLSIPLSRFTTNLSHRYMENGSMRGLLQSFGAFPEQLVAQFMEQVLNGLIYLHDAGVIHRDIKAANSMSSYPLFSIFMLFQPTFPHPYHFPAYRIL